MKSIVTLKDIEEAELKLKDVVMRTPLQYSKRLSKKYKADIYIKREDIQEVRSFKIRGAYNKMAGLSNEEKKRGVVCASAGNHAQGVAYSCNLLKIHGVIFMPVVTPNQKIDKVQHFGDGYIKIKLVGNTFDDASIASQVYAKENNKIYVHPFDDPLTIAGQGTIGKEIYEKLGGKIDYLVAAIGGGGLISGISTYLKGKNKNIKCVGAEPDGAASMYEALRKRKVITLEKIDTFVDGAAVKTVGDLTFKICKKNLEKVVRVPSGKDCMTMIELYQNEGIIAEPAGALAVASLDEIAKQIKGKKVVCIISGGNNDILRYPEIMERSLIYQGRKHYFIIEFAQKPGQLRKFVDRALGPNDDIVRFEYIKQTNKKKGPALVGIELRDRKYLIPLLNRIKEIELNDRKITNSDLLYDYLV